MWRICVAGSIFQYLQGIFQTENICKCLMKYLVKLECFLLYIENSFGQKPEFCRSLLMISVLYAMHQFSLYTEQSMGVLYKG